ncbi:DNA translocase FtsK [Alkalilacustris brevis]|uniref:DNA translocase FtsK n=1 Tax=Alkalilacustris brevis TaxID=2026338 RepID=UPI000E0D8DFA|nr:DNA translocase FtsK 4TM domain-containing protein [Alkalilacustris brevis]
MASYNARHRDPFLDSSTRVALERRAKELIGLGLIGLAVAVAMMLGSYMPDDPNWLAATDEPAQNLLGRFGASVAAALFIIAGHGAWAIVFVLGAWGLRFVLHRGGERAFSRAIFAPIAVALASIYAATLVPSAGWEHSFGLGGLFGDTILGAILSAAPVQATFGLRVISLLLAVGMVAMGLFVTGFVRPELRAILRYFVLGLLLAYATTLRLMVQLFRGGRVAAASLRDRKAMQHPGNAPAARHEAAGVGPGEATGPAPVRRVAPSVVRAAGSGGAEGLRAQRPAAYDVPAQEPAEAPTQQKSGLLARLPELVRRRGEPTPPPELIEHELPEHARGAEAPDDDRIKARIADVIRARSRQVPVLKITRQEPPVVRGAGPEARAASLPGRAMPATPPQEAPPRNLYASDTALHGHTAEHDPFLDDGHDADFAAARPALSTRKVVQHPPRKPAPPSRRAQEEAQPALRFEDPPAPEYELPPLSLLSNPGSIVRQQLSDEALEENARMLENVLDDYGVKGEIVSVRPGPVVTLYELEPAPGLKASRVIGLSDDIARSMSALSARVSTVPGRSVIGIELPNAHREKVLLREILGARDFGDTGLRLPLALGKGIDGEPIVANLAKMPHLLIAGTTGSGKSVAINTMILSLLYKLNPEECRLIMIDPKMLELSVYDGIPHLLSPVVTDPKKAVVALKWVVGEMEERYRKMSKMGVRNIEGFNGRVREALAKGEMFQRTVQTGFDDETGEPVFETDEFAPETLPYIVVVVDEMADLMMVAGKEIEACIQRLAQMARASGIHLIMATQRPSVDVITGTIKANFPTRISFQVTSKIDSRTILGEMGAEQLLGMGDMLYMAGGGRITRIHGPFVSDEEVEEVVNHLKSFGPPEYVGGVVSGPDDGREADIDAVLGLGGNTDGEDALYDQALAIVARDRKCSTSYIQRKLGIGYNKAARLVEQMEDEGAVSSANHVGKREVLLPEP